MENHFCITQKILRIFPNGIPPLGTPLPLATDPLLLNDNGTTITYRMYCVIINNFKGQGKKLTISYNFLNCNCIDCMTLYQRYNQQLNDIRRLFELEQQRQLELEQQRQLELERQQQLELERQRQLELEQQRQLELERQRQLELEQQRQLEKQKKCYSEHGKCSICLENNIHLVLFQCGNGHTFCNTCNISLWQLTQHCPVCRGIKKY